MVSARGKALRRLWRDRCTVYVRREVTDPVTHLTELAQTTLAGDVPCRLSFSTLAAVSGDELPRAAQAVKLFLAPDIDIPAGCKIAVRRAGTPERTLVFARSGQPAVYSEHQEISLELFGGWA